MVTENEKDYSDYVQHMSNLFNGLLFMLGFMFAVFAIVLTQLPDPSALSAQLTMFFFSILLGLIGFLALAIGSHVLYFCKRVPPLSKRIIALNTLHWLVCILEGLTVPLLFALWNLPLLAFASGIVWVLFTIADIVFIIRPFRKYRKTVH